MTYRKLVMSASIIAFSIGGVAVFHAEVASAQDDIHECHEDNTLIQAAD